MKIKFTAALNDSSGYSEASRNYLFALDTLVNKKTIELCAISPKFELWQTDVGCYKPLIDKYCSKSFKPDLQIIHLTPDCYLKTIDPSCKNVGYMAWETTRLPDKWVEPINALDEVWVPSQFNVDALLSSGIKIPVHKIPHAINVDNLLAKAEGVAVDFNIPDDKYTFYSIFQWTERKNPTGLLKAYISEFSSKDDVCLVIKSYVKSHGAAERDFIRAEIQRVKKSMFISDSGPIVFIGGDLRSNQIAQLHKRGDCLVFPTRAEGWGLCQFESMAFGKPVISTDFSGHLEFMNNENSYLTKSLTTAVSGMPWDLYTGKMEWAEPGIGHLKQQMRHVVNNQDEARAKGAIAAQDVRRFTWENVGQMMWERIQAVMGSGK